MHRRSKWVLLGIAIVLLVLACCVALALWCGAYSGHSANRPAFQSDIWKQDVVGEKRRLMVPDLRMRLRSNMTSDEIVQLLGQPDRIEPPAGVFGARPGDGAYWYYNLALGQSDLDAAYFVIVLDSNGTLLRSSVFSH